MDTLQPIKTRDVLDEVSEQMFGTHFSELLSEQQRKVVFIIQTVLERYQ